MLLWGTSITPITTFCWRGSNPRQCALQTNALRPGVPGCLKNFKWNCWSPSTRPRAAWRGIMYHNLCNWYFIIIVICIYMCDSNEIVHPPVPVPFSFLQWIFLFSSAINEMFHPQYPSPGGVEGGAMVQFEQLLTNRHFLLAFVDTLENQKTFNIRDKWVVLIYPNIC